MKSKASVLLMSIALVLPCSVWAQQAEVSGQASATAETTAATAAAEATAAPAAAEEGGKSKKSAAKGVQISPPQAGKGKIVFFRAPKLIGGAMGYKVREGETVLGILFAGKYFVAEVEPGAHEYVVHSETKDVLAIEVEAGEIYYVQGGVSMGVIAGRPNLSPATQADFDAISAKLKERSK